MIFTEFIFNSVSHELFVFKYIFTESKYFSCSIAGYGSPALSNSHILSTFLPT